MSKEQLNNKLQYIERYLDAGFNIIPLQPESKLPAYDVLPIDAKGKAIWRPLSIEPFSKRELETIYKNNPELNLGLITGSSSAGLVVIDVDYFNREILNLLARYHTTLVETKRGFHHYFLTDVSLQNYKFDWGEFLADTLYANTPPSIHPLGTLYQFVPGYELDKIVLIPDEIVNHLKHYKSPRDKRNSKKTIDKTNYLKTIIMNGVDCYV